ncbi:hypothetical protein HOLleu_39451 [Holothuria leucospilota]|uniref:EamA domain-containing protein n=1 Tax=Holothuria leucospilota TaxID=206669 RepID=A0A9Q0YK81_HOLLE|nr:hypothetical protein HOLleu_39451 [Holothuria leucospilota]
MSLQQDKYAGPRMEEEETSGIFKRMGLVWAILSAASLTIEMELLTKLTLDFPLSQVLFFRQASLLPFVLFLPWTEGEDYDWYDLFLNMLFGFGDTIGKAASVAALTFISPGNVSAIAFNKSIPVSIIACIFLGEFFDVVDGALAVANCIGLILIAKGVSESSEDFSYITGVMLSLTAMAAFILLYFVARVLANRKKAEPCLLSFMAGWIGVVFSSIFLTVTSSWHFPETLNDGLLILSSACATMFHFYALTRALKTENMLFVAAGLSTTIPLTYCYDGLFNGIAFAWETILGACLTTGSTLLLYAKTYCREISA